MYFPFLSPFHSSFSGWFHFAPTRCIFTVFGVSGSHMVILSHQFAQLHWVGKSNNCFLSWGGELSPPFWYCARACQELHVWAPVPLTQVWHWWLLLLGGQAALERAVGWFKCSAPHKSPGKGVLVIRSPRRLFCMPLESLASLDPICSDWLSSHAPQAVLLEVEQSAFNIHLWDWVFKLAQPLKYRSYKGCAQRPICWDNAMLNKQSWKFHF